MPTTSCCEPAPSDDEPYLEVTPADGDLGNVSAVFKQLAVADQQLVAYLVSEGDTVRYILGAPRATAVNWNAPVAASSPKLTPLSQPPHPASPLTMKPRRSRPRCVGCRRGVGTG